MKKEGLRILLLADAGSFHTERFAHQLKSQGCRVLTASLEEGRMRRVRLRRLGPVKSFHYLLAVPQVKRIIKRFRPDVINAHYASGYGFIAARAVGKEGPPIVLNLWGSDVLVVPHRSAQHRMKVRMALEGADCVVGDSRYLVESAKDVGRIRRSEVIAWGIERKFMSKHKACYDLGKPLRIITPRTHEEIYDNGFILDSLKAMVAAGEITLTFPDFGSLAARFKDQAGKLLDHGVQLYTKMGRSEFLSFFAEHDVCLSASRSDSTPASLVEAMALGLIPVAARTPGVAEWLTTETGFTFEPDNAGELCGIIRKFTSSSDTLEAMRRRNLQRVEREAIFEQNVAQQLGIMTELAGGSA
ncbi:MAG: glycosyltransferase [Candidatus Zixiibacteriota bacterium]|nr:MAG: glycosyltransferase [candidate division Zixibacteria bacterium]